jgi:hypothetical protein
MSAFKKIYLGPVLLILLTCSLAFSQDVVQKSIKVDGKSVNYSVLQPAGDVAGILLLFPGKGENPKSVFKKTALPEKLMAKGYLTIVPNLKYALFADELTKAQLGEILKTETESRPSAGVAIGGFSAGGAVAMSYAEYMISQGSTNIRCLFVIDPPLDLQRLYATSRKMRRFNCPSVASEAQQSIDYLDKALGGSPDDQYNNYVGSSPYMASEADGGNAKWLKQLPVRLYTEPDIEFVKERQCAEMETQDLNGGDLEKLYKQLRKSGNDRCELILTKGRGYNSWNIADADELAAWVVKF